MMDFSQRLQQLSTHADALTQFGRGLERESLRITADRHLSQQPHPVALGSALTNKWITTDFAESLLEFITPVSTDIDQLLWQLEDIHKFALSKMDGERLWPMSMPCFVGSQDDITLAQYGSSNTGRMKTLYREGLKHRYGSVMQIISGVHFNFSFSDSFWDGLFGEQTPEQRQESVSDAYFGLIRNYYRFGWLIPYLFGASPALCGSFIKDDKVKESFSKVGTGTYYLENATALRLSDLGYTNNAQSSLKIGFNSLDQYLEGLNKAIHTPSKEFADIGVIVDGERRQLNSNVLQIENELYAPIRAKRVTKSGEKPSEALKRGGVEYIEVRSLDVNPFSPIGISEDQVRFLDLFLTWAVLTPSADMDDSELACWRDNWNRVVIDGRNPELMLKIGCAGERLSLKDWGSRVFAELEQVAKTIDELNGNTLYQQTCERLLGWIHHPERTLSAQLLEQIKAEQGIGNVGYKLAAQHLDYLNEQGFRFYDTKTFEQEVHHSIEKQQQIERDDTVSFDEYLDNYFADINIGL
ncbi:glutamate--cysteine ligase [Photobacterium lucens]|uniref:glutamate--cysteine ligase n=1 Tax=Photobacterium lucens TaxID=2562949 RepID=UPI001656C45D|nr:glutamate--cysteine ligase [Photobacterium lucens]